MADYSPFLQVYNIPVIAIVLVGLFTNRVPALGAKIAIVFHVIAYAYLQFIWKVDINFIHIYAILFIIEVSIMLLAGHIKPRHSEWRFTRKSAVDLAPWRFAIPCSLVLVAMIISLYLIFSEIGFVEWPERVFCACHDSTVVCHYLIMLAQSS